MILLYRISLVHCHLAKRRNIIPIQSKENQMEVDSTSFEEVTRIPWVKSMENDVIPERAITVGYNGPTKCNVTPEGMLKDIKAKFMTKVLVKEKKEHT